MDDNEIEDGEIEDGEIEEDVEPSPVEKTEIKEPIKVTTSNVTKVSKVADYPDEDDFAGSVENAIASALKRDGVELPTPIITKSRNAVISTSTHKSKSSSKRKRKHDADYKSRDSSYLNDIDDELEFMNVRGASPTPAPTMVPNIRDYGGYSSDSSNQSYSSNDSAVMSYNSKKHRKGSTYKKFNKRSSDSSKRNSKDKDDNNEGYRKMELCKFYLMECCAKRDKCLYMHSDFPCKYYYLGMHCFQKDKDKCKFHHGEPLTDGLRAILLKHLETAPKEILGDFPRINRENAIKMLDTTAAILEIKSNPSSKNKHEKTTKIPSLLDMQISKPESTGPFQSFMDEKHSKPKKTRWCSKDSTSSGSAPSTANYLNLKLLIGKLLTSSQVQQLENLGIETIDQLNSLTMANLNELGLSVDQMRAIQLNALNINQLGLSSKSKPTDSNIDQSNVIAVQDQIKSIIAPLSDSKGDIDMRVLPPIPAPAIIDSKIGLKPIKEEFKSSISKETSSSIDYSQYLKDSNIDSHSDDEDDLKINIKLDIDKNSDSSPIHDPGISDLNEQDDFYTNRKKLSSKAHSNSSDNDENSESESTSIKAATNSKQDNRVTMYDTSTHETDKHSDLLNNAKQDTDMRVLNPQFPFDDDPSNENRSSKFSKNFLSISNYEPATEIDASITSHDPIEYKLYEVEMPKPDYSDIRRQFPTPTFTLDPRLRRIFALHNPSVESASAERNVNQLSNIVSKPPPNIESPNSKSRVDPRLKKDSSVNQISSNVEKNIPSFDYQNILQKSIWFKNLSSNQKIVVNQNLADLCIKLKDYFNSNDVHKMLNIPLPTKQILYNLGVFIDDQGRTHPIQSLNDNFNNLFRKRNDAAVMEQIHSLQFGPHMINYGPSSSHMHSKHHNFPRDFSQ